MIIPIDIHNGKDIADDVKPFIIQNAERFKRDPWVHENICLLYTSDAADE